MDWGVPSASRKVVGDKEQVSFCPGTRCPVDGPCQRVKLDGGSGGANIHISIVLLAIRLHDLLS